MSNCRKLTAAGVQFSEELVDVKLVMVSTMFNGLEFRQLALVAIKAVTNEYGYRCWIAGDNVADDHIFGDHTNTSSPTHSIAIGRGSFGLYQCLDGCFNPVHTLGNVLHADCIGKTCIAVVAESNAGNQCHFSIFKKVGSKIT